MTIEKRRNYTRAQWGKLQSAIANNNSKDFWEIVRGDFRTNFILQGNIEESLWVSHFSTLFFDPAIKMVPIQHPQELSQNEWPPVTVEQTLQLIMELKVGKVTGTDAVPAEWIKADSHFWVPILAKLFTAANDSGVFPEARRSSILVPIFKKGDKQNPENYRPISLLSIVGKLYAKLLLHRVNLWINQHDIGPEQIGFRKGKSTLDHCLVLNHLAYKYTFYLKSKLYVAFLDLVRI